MPLAGISSISPRVTLGAIQFAPKAKTCEEMRRE